MKKKFLFKPLMVMLIAAFALICICLPGVEAIVFIPPPDLNPLNQTQVPEPPQLFLYVKNKAAAVALGKALFWDMQAGSDGTTACATCHFSAGADNRMKNTLNPGLDTTGLNQGGDTVFGNNTIGVPGFPQFRPNYTLLPTDFPLHQRQEPADSQSSSIIRDTNDVVGSQGVRRTRFIDVVPGSAVDSVVSVPDPVFNAGGVNTRRVTGRNAPSVINSVFNFTNFWDGRAGFVFNGENPFGPLDQNAGVWFNDSFAGLVKRPVEIQFASLASLATAPPLNDVEMSATGRTFPKLGKKMLSLTPLGKQLVHPNDSVLGFLSSAGLQPDGSVTDIKGLRTNYTQMIQNVFWNDLWNSPQRTPDGYTQIEANFSLFWGLAIQTYLATLVSDQTPFDRYLAGESTALTEEQLRGFSLFSGIANCVICHGGIEFTNASAANAAFVNNFEHALIEVMFVSTGDQVIYDDGFNNTAVRPSAEDRGRGGSSLFTNPLTGRPYPLAFSSLSLLESRNLLPFSTPILDPFVPITMPDNKNGLFKAPGLRNVELTAPYFHNGSVMTLEEVMDLYVRGGNFPQENLADLDPLIGGRLMLMQGKEAMHAAIVAFLKSLTDPRVRNESAPFDHPELFIPEGEPEVLRRIAAKDANGTAAFGLTLTLNPVTSPTALLTQVLSGTAESGATVVVSVRGGAPSPALVNGTSWTFTASLVQGLNTIAVSATAAGNTTVLPTVTINVVTNAAPVITSSPVTTATPGLPYSYDVNATDPNGDVLIYSLVLAPAGMTIDPNTGLILWTPSAAQAGNNGVTARVSDSGGLSASQSFTATVTTAFSISGRVTDSFGQSVAGVTMTLISGETVRTVLTDALGNFSFTGLSNGLYEVIPFKAGLRFSPVSRDVTINNASRTGQNFRTRERHKGQGSRGR